MKLRFPLFALAVMTLLIGAAVLNSTEAAKPGPSGTVTVDPASPVAGVEFDINGEDYKGTTIFVTFDGAASLVAFPERQGSWSATWTHPDPGSLTIRVYEKSRSGRWRYVTQTTIQVQ